MAIPHAKLHRGLLRRAPAPALTTVDGVVMSVVYVTAKPTFTGVIGGLTTLSDDDDSTPSTSAARYSSNTNFSVSSSRTQTASSASSSSSALTRSSSQTSTAAFSFTTSTGLAATALMPSETASNTNTAVFGASTSEASSSSTDTGMPMGAKIGMAVGVILGVGAIAILVLLLLARKRRQMTRQAAEEDEKNNGGNPLKPVEPAVNPSPAPRLSLRPMSGLTEFIGSTGPKNRTSQGNMLTPISEAGIARSRNATPSPASAQVPGSFAERPKTSDNPFKDPENPFADPEKGMMALSAGSATSRPTVAPVVTGTAVTTNETPKNQRSSGPTADSFPLPQSSGHGQVIIPTRKPVSAQPPSPIAIPDATAYAELPGAPSPVVAPGPGPDGPQSNVYRILMDFRPTMEDELELRAGQLVRMLHEYDDGWALCIRLDRSQQGVVPRTCLAAKPSKPRPGPPPTGPGSRPITPQGRPRGPPGPGHHGPRPQGPPSVRAQSPASMSPNTGAFNQPPRPLSPGPRPQPQAQQPKRSASPGPYAAGGPTPMAPVEQRRRSNSASALSVRNKRNSPPGPSKLGPGVPPPRSDSPGLAM